MQAFPRIPTEYGKWRGRADRGQRSSKGKQKAGVGVRWYVSPAFCAASQTPCKASIMPLIRQKSKIFATFPQGEGFLSPKPRNLRLTVWGFFAL